MQHFSIRSKCFTLGKRGKNIPEIMDTEGKNIRGKKGYTSRHNNTPHPIYLKQGINTQILKLSYRNVSYSFLEFQGKLDLLKANLWPCSWTREKRNRVGGEGR